MTSMMTKIDLCEVCDKKAEYMIAKSMIFSTSVHLACKEHRHLFWRHKTANV